MLNVKYAALDLAKYIVSKCTREGKLISNLQLQKILYFIQREYLTAKGCTAFPEDIEAWQFGPVVPEVYFFFCGYGAMDIDRIFANININDELIDKIIEEKRLVPPWALVEETHKPGRAWDIVFENGLGNRRVIPTGLIKTKG